MPSSSRLLSESLSMVANSLVVTDYNKLCQEEDKEEQINAPWRQFFWKSFRSGTPGVDPGRRSVFASFFSRARAKANDNDNLSLKKIQRPTY
jgi:hypothetical protein